MSTWNRSPGRNVFIYDIEDPETILGGLVCTRGITNSNLYSMVEVFLFFSKSYDLQHENGMKVPRDEKPLQAGKYYVITAGMRYSLLKKDSESLRLL